MCGLELRRHKCCILLPGQAACCTDQLSELPTGVEVTRDGMIIAGAPIGTDDFGRNEVAAVVRDARTKLEAVRGIDPQVGFVLLHRCIARALNFIIQVCPPAITAEQMTVFDDAMARTAQEMLTRPELHTPVMGPRTADRCQRKMRLPHRLNGAALTAMRDVAAAAWLGSLVTSAARDERLAAHVHALDGYQEQARDELTRRLPRRDRDTPSEGWVALPDGPNLLDVTFFKQLLERQPGLKLQKLWSDDIHREACRRLRVEEGDATDAAFVSANTRGLGARLLQLPLSEPAFRLQPLAFVAWFRFQFKMPQLCRSAEPGGLEILDYEADICLSHSCRRCPILDADGNHANNGKCVPTLIGRALRHNMLKWVIHYFAVLAGCIATLEPPTHRLLLDLYSAAQCRGLFPKRPSAKHRRESKELVNEFARIHQLPNSKERTDRLTAANEQLQALTSQAGEKKGIRIDVQIMDPLTGEEAWVDTSCVHPYS